MNLKWPPIPEKLVLPLLFAARILIGLLFFYSGFSKLTQPIEYFEIAVGLYEIVPQALVHAAAMVIPWIELVGGTFLLLGYALEKSAAVLSVLTGLFQLVLGQAVVRRLPIDECGCFGGGLIHLTLYQSFVLDTVLVLFLIQIAAQEENILSLDNRLLKS